MKDSSKIIAIYTVAATICVLILAITFYIRRQRIEPPMEATYEVKHTGPLLTLEKDLTLTNQDGKEVQLSDLKGKVWGVAQFFAACPECAKRNTQGLKQLYEKFKHEPDFHLICITVDPQNDNVAELKQYAKTLGADTANWWFLTGEADKLSAYMLEEMKFDPVIKRTDPDEAAAKGAYKHNMGIRIFDRNMGMVKSFDLYQAKTKGTLFYDSLEKKLHQTVQQLLDSK